MRFDYSQIWPYFAAVLAVLLIYRRLRRSFGRQPLSPARMGLRMALLVVLGGALLPLSLRSGQFLGMELAGLAAGVALGVWGAARTRFSKTNGRLQYLPHTYTGVAVSLLFVGRFVYRMVELYSLERSAGMAPGGAADQSFGSPLMVRNPTTVGLLFVVVGYYVCYYGLVLWKSRHLRPEDLEVAATSNAALP